MPSSFPPKNPRKKSAAYAKTSPRDRSAKVRSAPTVGKKIFSGKKAHVFQWVTFAIPFVAAALLISASIFFYFRLQPLMDTSPAAGTETPQESSTLHGDGPVFPYEEPLHVTLEERVYQIDYALIQTAWERKMPAKAMRLAHAEDRRHGKEYFQYQRIDILPGGDTLDFLVAFKISLAAWAPGASLTSKAENQWGIAIDGIETHALAFFPGLSRFESPSSGDSTSSPQEPEEEQPTEADNRPRHLTPVPPPPRAPKTTPRGPEEEAMLVIVMDDLGASLPAVQTLLDLNFPVTMAFWPHGFHTRTGAALAYESGREILIHQPMEPLGYPGVKPGPGVLLVGMQPAEIQRILANAIEAVPHAVGLNNHMGSRFTQNRAGISTVITVLKDQGLFALDSLTHNRSIFDAECKRLGLLSYRRNIFLDVTPTKYRVLEELRRAERIALYTGKAIAIGHPLPATLEALKEWQAVRNPQVRLVRLHDLP